MENKLSNIVQVYGLPRSGTNYIEWLLINNFSDIKYKNIYAKCDVSGIKEFGRKNSLKHNYPNLNYSDYAIVIYKTFNMWVESMNRDNRGTATKDCYDKYLQIANNLPKDRSIVVEFSDAVNDYKSLVKKISSLINIEHNENIIRPVNRLTKGGAVTKQTNIKFID